MRKSNNIRLLTVGLYLIICILSCSVLHSASQDECNYLVLSDSVRILDKYERHIQVLYNKDSIQDFVDDDRIILNKMDLDKTDRICLLREYLDFSGNQCFSNKQFPNNFGRSENRLKILKENIKWPIEVEALYSMTTMLFKDNVIISPVVMNIKNGKVCNFSRDDMDQIYEIYRTWFSVMEKSEFSTISWPLKNSNYRWLGEDAVKDIHTLLKESL